MDNAIAKAAALVEAHEYIRRFAGKIIVVKVGGSIMDEPDNLRSVITDICFMDAVGMHPVVIHGGGKSITTAMQKAGLEAHFVQGYRYTDERTLAIAESVLVNEVNRQLADWITQQGHKAMVLHSLASCAVFGKRMYLPSAEDPTRKVDIGFVGEVDWVNAPLLRALMEADYIPVIAPIARDAAGGKLNVNADLVAGHVAAALQAEKLILVSDTHGIRTGQGQESLASSLTKNQIQELVSKGVIGGGILPKVEASFIALAGGVKKVHIVDGGIPHSPLLEVYTTSGIGTEIVMN